PAVDVANDPAGQREVEEQRSVVGCHGGGQRQVDAETTGHDLPPPSTAQGRQHSQARRCRKRSGVDRADALEERARAQTPDEDGEYHGGANQAPPRPPGPAHGDLPGRGRGPNAVRKRLRKALIGQTGAWGLGRKPLLPPHLAIRCRTAGSWAMTEIGTS